MTLPALVGISFAFVAVSTSMTTLLQTDTDPRTARTAARHLRDHLRGTAAARHRRLRSDRRAPVGLFNAIGVGALLVGATTVLVVVTPSFRARVAGLSLGRGRARRGPRYTGLRMFHGRRGMVAAMCLLLVAGCSSSTGARPTRPSPVIARVAADAITLAQFNIRYSSALREHQAGRCGPLE